MLRVFKYFILTLILSTCLGMIACKGTAGDDSDSASTSTKGTKSANITITGTDLQTISREAIDATDNGEYLLSDQPVDSTVNVILTLYNSGDVAADKIKAFTLTSPLAYAGGSYPGTGGSCTKKIGAQQTCTVVLAFTIPQMGEASSTFQISYYNGKISRTFEKVFKGKGYSVPQISQVSPAYGKVSGGNQVIITGTHIFSGATVSVGGNTCPVLYTNAPTSVTCVLPAHSAGAVDVTVTNTDAQTATSPGSLIYIPPPTVTSVSPTAGALAGGTTLTITGTGFVSGVTIVVGGNNCGTVSVVSSTSVTCVTSAHSAATVDIIVTNPETSSATGSSLYTYQPGPSITSVSPSSGRSGGGEYMTITGTNFSVGVTATVGGNACTSLSRINSTTLNCVIPSGVIDSTVDVVATNADAQTVTASGAYSYNSGESWSQITTTNLRWRSSADAPVWTGSKALFYGGQTAWVVYDNSGDIYDPVTNSSTPMNTVGAPPGGFTAGVWTGSKFIAWGVYNGAFLNVGGIYDPQTNSWSATTTNGAPLGRQKYNLIWTGSKMLVLGGASCGTNAGGIYDPTTNTWQTTSTINAPAPDPQWMAEAWTGKYFLTVGKKYDPDTDTWTSLSTVNAPAGGYKPSAATVWTGTKLFVSMNPRKIYDLNTDTWSNVSTVNAPLAAEWQKAKLIGSKIFVWGGFIPPESYSAAGQATNTGGIYDPDTNTWIKSTTVGAPPGTWEGMMVWTGSKAIVWGGTAYWAGPIVSTGGIYTPPAESANNTWTTMTTTGAPSRRRDASAVWTGSKLIVYGGWNCGGACDAGGIYDPLTNSWAAIPNSTTRMKHTAVWTGSKMLTWGGTSGGAEYNTGAFYDPSANTWTSITTTGAPITRQGQVGVWTGAKLIVFGGTSGATCLNDGGAYDVQTTTWSSLSTTGAPIGRGDSAYAYNGRKLLIFGGYEGFVGPKNTGGVYDTLNDTWTTMTTTGAPSWRTYHTYQWSGSKLLVWGGTPDFTTYLNTGGNYDLDTNSWTSITTVNAPTARIEMQSAWTGSEMIVWGGSTGNIADPVTNTGGIYNPLTDTWRSTTTLSAPQGVNRASTIWIGSKMLIFGGNTDPANSTANLNTGYLYTP